MKKIVVLAILLSSMMQLSAKKVKFSVDMTGQNASGIKVMGDFQSIAGLGIDFTPDSSCNMIQDPMDTNIYNLIVDVPAFATYQYLFVKGISYDVEIVPEYSQVGYTQTINANSNRWIYVDSLANDTTFVGSILFGGNAPKGKMLTRYLVNMQNETVSPNGVHFASNTQGWNAASDRMVSFVMGLYEIIRYDSVGNYSYKFYNGTLASNAENVPSACAASGNRMLQVSQDSVLSRVCFSSCSICIPTSVENQTLANSIVLFPNPMSSTCDLVFHQMGAYVIDVVDMTGNKVRTYQTNQNRLTLQKLELNSGVYFLKIRNKQNETVSLKLIVQ